MVQEKNKQQLINYIDEIKEIFFATLGEKYKIELNDLRKKYIFKDISTRDFINDVKTIKKIETDIKMFYYQQ